MKPFALIVLLFGLSVPPVATAQSKGERNRARYTAKVEQMARSSRPPPRAVRAVQRQRNLEGLRRQGSLASRQRTRPNNALRNSNVRGRNVARLAERRARREDSQRVFTPSASRNVAAAQIEQNEGRRNRSWRDRDGDGDIDRDDRRRRRDRDGDGDIDSDDRRRRDRDGDGDIDRNDRRWRDRDGDGDIDRGDRRRRRHDRRWWRSNYSRFALFGGGYYYLNSGFWYPAYGYDPYFNYTSDAPISAYDGQSPGQEIEDVQAALQERGYYRGAVDGDFGPRTRSALLAFQRDGGLPVTGEIDEATLSALGFE